MGRFLLLEREEIINNWIKIQGIKNKEKYCKI
jgi:hypothetical protein